MSVCFRHASSADHVGKNMILRLQRIQEGDLKKKTTFFMINKKKKECAMSYTLLSFPYAF